MYTHFLACLQDGASRGGNARPHVSALLGHGASDGRALHLTLGVHDHTGVVLEVDVHAIESAPRLALTHDHSGVHCGKRGDELEGGQAACV